VEGSGGTEVFNLRRLGACVSLDEAATAICYPRPWSGECREVLRELVDAGVECYIDYGECMAGRLRMIGRGWAANVFLARLGRRLVVVKALRPDSRRRSVAWEAAAWTAAWWLGAAPEPVYAGLRILVVEPVLGGSIDGYRPRRPWELLYLLSRLLWKAYMLDRAGLIHSELARPHDHVLLSTDKPPDPFLVDFESARLRRGRRSNLTQLVGGLLGLPCILGWLPREGRERLRSLLRRYRLGLIGVEVLWEVVGVVEHYLQGLGDGLCGAEEEGGRAGEEVGVQQQGGGGDDGCEPGRRHKVHEG